jgi:hypothetical protein
MYPGGTVVTDQGGVVARKWLIILREPLVFFIVFGAILYVAWTALAPREKT